MEEEGRPAPGLPVLLAVLRRRRKAALITLVLALTAVASIVRFLPDVYRSSATVLIDRQQIPDELVRSTVTSGLEIRLHTISQEILSRARLQGLIERFGLYPALRRGNSMEAAVDRMRDDIHLNLRSGSHPSGASTVAFTISYTGRDAAKVALVANTLASFYIEENLKVRERQAAGTADFLRAQLDEMKRKLEKQEQAVSAFKERHIGQLPQQMEANLATIEQLNAQLRLNSDQQIQVSERKASFQKQLEDAEATVNPGSARALNLRLDDLNKQLAALRTRYSDRYPDVRRLKAEIAVVQEELDRLAETPESPAAAAPPQVLQLRSAITDLDARARALQVEAANLHRALAQYQTRVENVPRTEQEYQRLARDYEASKEQYRSLLLRQSEAEVAESMEQRQKGEQFRIVEPAVVAERPTAPNRPMLFVLGALLAFGLAAGAVVVREQLDTSLHSSDELRQRSRVPVLAAVPLIATREGLAARRRHAAVTVVATAVGVGAVAVLSYVLAGAEDALLAGLILSSAP